MSEIFYQAACGVAVKHIGDHEQGLSSKGFDRTAHFLNDVVAKPGRVVIEDDVRTRFASQEGRQETRHTKPTVDQHAIRPETCRERSL
jgi:hypothetical protein